MKSTVNPRLGVYERERSVNIVNDLLNRHVCAHQAMFPLTPEDCIQLWLHTMAPYERALYDATREFRLVHPDEDSPLSMCNHLPFRIQFGETVLLMQVSRDFLLRGKFPMFYRNQPPPPCPVYSVLSEKKATSFVDWSMKAVHLVHRVQTSIGVLEKVIDLANTAGQLQRMAPDLLKYMHELTNKALQGQERRSPLPNEWMEVDRLKLRCALDHLGVCYLLPKATNSRDRIWSSDEWVFDQMVDRASYDLRAGIEKRDGVSKYTLPESSNPMELGTFTHG